MKTTEPRCLINRLDNRNTRCEGSNQWHKSNGFSLSMVRFRTCSELAGIISKRSTIDSFKPERFPTGDR